MFLIHLFREIIGTILIWSVMTGSLSFLVLMLTQSRFINPVPRWVLAISPLGIPLALFQIVFIAANNGLVTVSSKFFNPFLVIGNEYGFSQTQISIGLILLLDSIMLGLVLLLVRVSGGTLRISLLTGGIGCGLLALSSIIFGSVFDLTGSDLIVIFSAPLALGAFPAGALLSSHRPQELAVAFPSQERGSWGVVLLVVGGGISIWVITRFASVLGRLHSWAPPFSRYEVITLMFAVLALTLISVGIISMRKKK